MEYVPHTADPSNPPILSVDDPDHPWVAGMIETMADATNMASACAELAEAILEGHATPEELESLSLSSNWFAVAVTTDAPKTLYVTAAVSASLGRPTHFGPATRPSSLV